MSLSGFNSSLLRPYTAREMIEEAASRAGIPPAKLTSEIVEKSLDQINLTFTSLLNRGIQLWKRQRMVFGCHANTAQIAMPSGINVIADLTRRSLTRNIGVPFSSSGGDPALAFDDDLSTSCLQVAANGNLGCMFSQVTAITSVGVYFTLAAELSYFIEYSVDGINWDAADAFTGVVKKNQWVWLDIDGIPPSLGWRIRESGSLVPLSVGELFFGNSPSEIPLDPWNITDYNSMPNKTSPGRVVNYYQQRNLNQTILYCWPVPDNSARYDQIVVWARAYLDTISQPTQSIDVPRRWLDAITSMLARRLCRSLEEADMSRYQMLAAEETEAVQLAEGEERDNSPTNIDMGLSAYTA